MAQNARLSVFSENYEEHYVKHWFNFVYSRAEYERMVAQRVHARRHARNSSYLHALAFHKTANVWFY